MKSAPDLPIYHLALRVPLHVRVNGKTFDILQEHLSVYRQRKSVSVGKFGRAPAQSVVSSVAQNYGKSELILVSSFGSEYGGHKAIISGLSRGCSLISPLEDHPSYYNFLSEKPSLWITVETEFEPCKLSRYKLAGNGKILRNVLSKCQTSLMRVINA